MERPARPARRFEFRRPDRLGLAGSTWAAPLPDSSCFRASAHTCKSRNAASTTVVFFAAPGLILDLASFSFQGPISAARHAQAAIPLWEVSRCLPER